MKSSDGRYEVNLFRPKSVGMKGEVFAILIVLAVWGISVFGFQLLLSLYSSPAGKSPLESVTFLNLPFHYWFTAQMLPLLFIIICALFNLFIDRLTLRQSRRRDDHND